MTHPREVHKYHLFDFFSFMTSLRRILKIVPEYENKVSEDISSFLCLQPFAIEMAFECVYKLSMCTSKEKKSLKIKSTKAIFS